MERDGAAVAMVLGEIATAVLSVWYLLHMRIIKPGHGDYKVQGNICGRMLTIGITSFLSQVSLVAAIAAINNMLRQYLNPFFQFYLDFFDVLWHQFVFPNGRKKVKNYARQQEENRSKNILVPEEKGKLVNTGKKFRYSAEE